jgi:ubiquinone/menaquinone biosynthesis C-methylase UbiE
MVEKLVPRLGFVPTSAAPRPRAEPLPRRAVLGGDSWRDVLRELLGGPPLRVLDIRSRDGDVALLLHAMGHYPHGVEPDADLVAAARRRAHERCAAVPFDVGDGEDLGYRSGVFDVVHACDVLATLVDPRAAAVEWFRVLRRGGRAVVAQSDAAARPSDFLRAGGFVDVETWEFVVRVDASAAPWYRRWTSMRRRYAVASGRRP